MPLNPQATQVVEMMAAAGVQLAGDPQVVRGPRARPSRTAKTEPSRG